MPNEQWKKNGGRGAGPGGSRGSGGGPVGKTASPPTGSTMADTVERQGGLAGLLGTGTRVASGFAGSMGGPTGAAITGGGEALAQLIEQFGSIDDAFAAVPDVVTNLLNYPSGTASTVRGFAQGAAVPASRIGMEAALGALPGHAFMTPGRIGQSAVKGGLVGGAGSAGRQFAETGSVDPYTTAESAAISAGLGGLLGRAFSPKSVGPNPAEFVTSGNRPLKARAEAGASQGIPERTVDPVEGEWQGRETFVDDYPEGPSASYVEAQRKIAVAEEAARKMQAEEARLKTIRIAREEAGVVPQPPSFSESMSAPTPGGGRASMSTRWAAPDEEGNKLAKVLTSGGGRPLQSSTPEVDPVEALRQALNARKVETPTPSISPTEAVPFNPPKMIEVPQPSPKPSTESTPDFLDKEISRWDSQPSTQPGAVEDDLSWLRDPETLQAPSPFDDILTALSGGMKRNDARSQEYRSSFEPTQPAAEVEAPLTLEGILSGRPPRAKPTPKLKQQAESVQGPKSDDEVLQEFQSLGDKVQDIYLKNDRAASPPRRVEGNQDELGKLFGIEMDQTSKIGGAVDDIPLPGGTHLNQSQGESFGRALDPARKESIDAAQAAWPDEVRTEMDRLGQAHRDAPAGRGPGFKSGKGSFGAQLAELEAFMTPGSKMRESWRGAPAPDQSALSKKLSGEEGFIDLGDMVGAFERNPQLAGRVGGGLIGAATGAASNEDDPFYGAILGGAVGAGGVAGLQKYGKSLGDVGQTAIDLIPKIQRFNYLVDPDALIANSIVGTQGAALTGGLEAGLSGDSRGWDLMKNSANPLSWMRDTGLNLREGRQRILEGDLGRSEGLGYDPNSKFQRVLSEPAAFMAGGDMTVQQRAAAAGFSEDESKAMTHLNEPEDPWLQKFAHLGRREPGQGQTPMGALMDTALPFKRTPTVLAESGALRTPGLGAILQQYRPGGPDPFKVQAVQQGLGAVGMGAGYVAGEEMEPETAKRFNRFITNAAGRYALPVGAGLMAGQASARERSPVQAGLERGLDAIPLPAFDTVKDWGRYLSEGFSPDKTFSEVRPPAGTLPKIIRENVWPEEESTTLPTLNSQWKRTR